MPKGQETVNNQQRDIRAQPGWRTGQCSEGWTQGQRATGRSGTWASSARARLPDHAHRQLRTWRLPQRPSGGGRGWLASFSRRKAGPEQGTGCPSKAQGQREGVGQSWGQDPAPGSGSVGYLRAQVPPRRQVALLSPTGPTPGPPLSWSHWASVRTWQEPASSCTSGWGGACPALLVALPEPQATSLCLREHNAPVPGPMLGLAHIRPVAEATRAPRWTCSPLVAEACSRRLSQRAEDWGHTRTSLHTPSPALSQDCVPPVGWMRRPLEQDRLGLPGSGVSGSQGPRRAELAPPLSPRVLTVEETASDLLGAPGGLEEAGGLAVPPFCSIRTLAPRPQRRPCPVPQALAASSHQGRGATVPGAGHPLSSAWEDKGPARGSADVASREQNVAHAWSPEPGPKSSEGQAGVGQGSSAPEVWGHSGVT